MECKCLPFFLGILSGALFAVSFVQYQGYSNPTPTSFLDYAEGGTSFYFVSLRGRNEISQARDNVDGGDARRSVEDILDMRRREVDEDVPQEETGHRLLDESGSERRVKREPKQGVLDGAVQTLDKELLASADFDPLQNANLLRSKAKIMCLVTLEQSTASRFGKPVQNTWLRHCNGILVMSNVPQSGGSTVVNVGIKGGESYRWSRTRLSLKHVHDKFLNHYDWFLKVPPDGFAVLENLRYLVLRYRASVNGYMGHVFKGPKGGGSVIILSREALKLIRPHLDSCTPSYFGGADDGEVLETCFRSLDVIASMDGRDSAGRYRSQMRVPKLNLPYGATGRREWKWRDIIHPELKVPECCRDYTVAFHHVDPTELYLLEFMVYHMRPFGIGHYNCSRSSTPVS
ncbi:glycoprotein-N-acetylgalactosamine 3-beta-galactosyltransferase 1-like [Diadema setosum]|uniref:glycoprotein-N-acetylgalactosamine 3-beta-galactosyltransferase 1-like n=1 Tax=Diadema setosum TaxID=31175 RepID=UPI003B3A3318